MMGFVRFEPRSTAILLAGALLLSLGGCVAAPLGQLAYQAATAPAKPCDSGNCGPSGPASMWDGLKGGLAGR